MFDDLELMVKVYIIKKNSDEYNWRFSIIYIAHALPAMALLIEMSMNRLRIPLHHIIYNIFIVCFYVFITYCYQIIDDFEAVFFNSLNWTCKDDWSFLYFKDTLDIPEDFV